MNAPFAHTAPQDDTAAIFHALLAPHRSKPVYPLYIAHVISKALKATDPEGIIKAIGNIETIGDCRYAIVVGDGRGTAYRVTVEVAR